MLHIPVPIPYELSNGGQGLAMRFDNDEYVLAERHHTKDGKQHDISTMFSSHLNALRCLQIYESMDITPFTTGVTQQETATLEGEATGIREEITRHFGRITFFRLDSDSASVFWMRERFKFTDSTTKYSETALLQPVFTPNVFATVVERTATPAVRENAKMISDVIAGQLTTTKR